MTWLLTHPLKPELFTISGDGIFESVHGPDDRDDSAAAHFEGGVCPACRSPRGPRTDAPLHIDGGWPADLGFLWDDALPPVPVISNRFLDLLTAEESTAFDIRPVDGKKRRGRRYFEVRARPTLDFVGIAGMDADGVECAVCGSRWFTSVVDPALNDEPDYLSLFVCRDDLPKPLPDLFAVGLRHDWHLCATRARVDRFHEANATVGLTSRRLGVVAADRCERRPVLARRMSRRECPVCSQWPEPMDVANERRAVFSAGDDEPSRRNWTWLAAARERGIIDVTRSTMDPGEIVDTFADDRQNRPQIHSFRCPECRRLGYIARTRAELLFIWH